jgi:PST family polysaccharide transporter
VFLLATNLQGVFFPSLTQLNAEPDRQFAAFRKAAGMLGLCAVVVSVLQITTAEPLIPLIFGEKWTRAVPVVQWLSVAIITQPLNVLATSVLLAWGQFRAVAMVTALTGALLTVAAVAGAGSGNERQIAAWTAGAILIGNLAPGWMVYRRCGQGLRRLAGDLLPLLLVGVPGLVLARAEILSRWGPVVHVVSVCCLVGLTSVGAARWITPELFREMVARSKELIGAACKPRS